MSTYNRIDVHQHIVPPFWAEALPLHGGDPSGWKSPEWSPASAIRFMDDLQIGCGILSLTAPGLSGWQGAARSEMARRINDYAAEIVHGNPQRFGNFVTLPLPDIDAALRELDYALNDLHADGVVLMNNYDGIYLGDARFEPLWQALGSRACVVFIHPFKPPMTPLDGMPAPLTDFPADTTRTALHMTINGVMRRYTRMKMILSHAGGFLPYACERYAELLPGLNAELSAEVIRDDLRRFYFDTALSCGSISLTALLAFARPGHVLYGSDYPYAPASVGASFTAQLDAFDGFQGELRAQVNRDSALILFPRLMK